MTRGVATLGAIKIDFVSSIADYYRASKKVRGSFYRIAQAAKKAGRFITSHMGAARKALLGVGAATLYAMKHMSDYSAKLVETSRNIGVTADGLEDIRSYFEGDGLGARKADKAMEALNKRLGEAQQGFGEAKKWFEIFGIELRNANGTFKSTETIFYEVAESIRGLGNNAQAGAAAAAIFSDIGKRMVTMFTSADRPIRNLVEHMGRFRTMTQDMHETNKDLNQGFTNLKDNLDDLKSRVLVNFAPELEAMIDKFNDWISGLKEDGDALESFAESLLKIAEATAKVVAAGSGALAGAGTGATIGGIIGGPPGAGIGAGAGALIGGGAGYFLTDLGVNALEAAAKPIIEVIDEKIEAERKGLADIVSRLSSIPEGQGGAVREQLEEEQALYLAKIKELEAERERVLNRIEARRKKREADRNRGKEKPDTSKPEEREAERDFFKIWDYSGGVEKKAERTWESFAKEAAKKYVPRAFGMPILPDDWSSYDQARYVGHEGYLRILGAQTGNLRGQQRDAQRRRLRFVDMQARSRFQGLRSGRLRQSLSFSSRCLRRSDDRYWQEAGSRFRRSRRSHALR